MFFLFFFLAFLSLSLGTIRNSLNQPNVWLTIFLASLLCVLPVVALRFILIQIRPTINDKVKKHLRPNIVYAFCGYEYSLMSHNTTNLGKDVFLQKVVLLLILLQVRYKTQVEAPPAPAPRRPVRRVSTRRSGYAFSHSQGYGALVTSERFLFKRPMKGRLAFSVQTDTPQPKLFRPIPVE